ncbi:MarR family transcriptional regulator, partial [Bacillus sp. HC-Mk]
MNKEEQVMNGFRELYNKLVWLNKDKMEEGLKGFKSSEVHCIEYIENNADSNVTQLAEAFYVTRGAISRMTKKLIQKGLIESYQMSTILFHETNYTVEFFFSYLLKYSFIPLLKLFVQIFMDFINFFPFFRKPKINF